MRLARRVQHPEKPEMLFVYECTECRLPMVRYAPATIDERR
jgi:hypothetical protein